jgi:signal transduction histidine kinase
MGTLMVANRRRTEFSPQEVELLEAFANWTSVAIESSQLYDKVESLARLEERERIGMDLHDGVMQSIYAVGLQLEAGLERLDDSPDESKDTVERAIETLNNIIKDIRSYIMDLRPRVSVVADLPDAIQQLVEDVRVNTLVQAEFTIDGSVKGLINQTEAIALFHIAQEALSNVIKHSRATRVDVRLSVGDRAVTVEVRDNGVGIDEKRAEAYDRQGLRNMRDRARSVGANLVLDSQPGKGTTVRVELPLRNEGANDE